MANVDPFMVQIPPALLEDKETREFFEYFVRWAHDMWIRTGGGNDAIENATIEEKYPWPTQQSFDEAKEFEYPVIPEEVKQFNSVTVTANYTAVAYDFINATNKALISFPEYPEENSVIIIRNGDGSVIDLDGNGKKINGSFTGRLVRKSTSIEFHYFIDSDEWFAR